MIGLTGTESEFDTLALQIWAIAVVTFIAAPRVWDGLSVGASLRHYAAGVYRSVDIYPLRPEARGGAHRERWEVMVGLSASAWNPHLARPLRPRTEKGFPVERRQMSVRCWRREQCRARPAGPGGRDRVVWIAVVAPANIGAIRHSNVWSCSCA